MSSMEAKVEILWNSLLLTWSYDYRVAGIHTFDKDGLAIGENLIERLNLETSWGTVTILETTDTSIVYYLIVIYLHKFTISKCGIRQILPWT